MEWIRVFALVLFKYILTFREGMALAMYPIYPRHRHSFLICNANASLEIFAESEDIKYFPVLFVYSYFLGLAVRMHTSGTTRADLNIFALSRAVRGSEGGNILGNISYTMHYSVRFC